MSDAELDWQAYLDWRSEVGPLFEYTGPGFCPPSETK